MAEPRDTMSGGLDDQRPWEMPCPAAGGVLCGSEDCLRLGCEDQRPATGEDAP